MVTLRNFEPSDAPALREQYLDMSLTDIQAMIGDWNKREFQGNYFEMFAIVADGAVAGTVSLWQLAPHTVSCGPEIFPAFRRKGYARAAMPLALALAKEKGYQIALHQIAADNTASLALHRALGFESDGYLYRNQKGKEVLVFCKALI